MFQFEASEYHGHLSWENTDLENFVFSSLSFFKLKFK